MRSNYSAGKDAEKLYAGGADGLQIRMVLRTAGQRGWSLLCTDIHTAFLNMEVLLVFKELGIVERDEMWVIDKAVYGLTTSPRDWSVRRDIEIRKMEWEGDGKRMKFVETEEPNLWRIIETGVVRGLMSIYVDDVTLAGEDNVIEAARARMDDGDWKLSPAQMATALRFTRRTRATCEREGVRGGLGGQVIHQKGTEALSYKLPDEDSKDGTPEEIREAQARCCGWLRRRDRTSRWRLQQCRDGRRRVWRLSTCVIGSSPGRLRSESRFSAKKAR